MLFSLQNVRMFINVSMAFFTSICFKSYLLHDGSTRCGAVMFKSI